MRIISSFRDYYDCVQSAGQDQTLIYRRETESARVDLSIPKASLGSYFLLARRRYIGFCGKVYFSVGLRKDDWQGMRLPAIDFHWCHSTDDLEKFVAANYTEKEKRKRGGPLYKFRRCFETPLESLVKAFSQPIDRNLETLFSWKSPIYVVDVSGSGNPRRLSRCAVEFNPCLSDYKFTRVLPPAQAFQELATYLASIAHPNAPIPPVSDADMLVVKGFDKFSFRNPKASPRFDRRK